MQKVANFRNGPNFLFSLKKQNENATDTLTWIKHSRRTEEQ